MVECLCSMWIGPLYWDGPAQHICIRGVYSLIYFWWMGSPPILHIPFMWLSQLYSSNLLLLSKYPTLFTLKVPYPYLPTPTAQAGYDTRSIFKWSLTVAFNCNHFDMRLLNLRINFYLLRTFCPHLGSYFFFVLFLLSWCFGQISSFEEGQRWNLAETLWKKKQHKKNYQDGV